MFYEFLRLNKNEHYLHTLIASCSCVCIYEQPYKETALFYALLLDSNEVDEVLGTSCGDGSALVKKLLEEQPTSQKTANVNARASV